MPSASAKLSGRDALMYCSVDPHVSQNVRVMPCDDGECLDVLDAADDAECVALDA